MAKLHFSWTAPRVRVMEHCDETNGGVTLDDGFTQRTLDSMVKHRILMKLSNTVYARTDDGLIWWNEKKLRDAESHKLQDLFLSWWRFWGDDTPIIEEARILPEPHHLKRFDFAFPSKMVAVEIHGAIWQSKRGHSSGSGLVRDYTKTRAANEIGWVIHTFTTAEMDEDSSGQDVIESVLKVFQNRHNPYLESLLNPAYVIWLNEYEIRVKNAEDGSTVVSLFEPQYEYKTLFNMVLSRWGYNRQISLAFSNDIFDVFNYPLDGVTIDYEKQLADWRERWNWRE